MKDAMLTHGAGDASQRAMRGLMLLPILIAVGACVQVSAPERPIEINLNVNVKQEVLVRLQRDAQQLIEENPELFPK
jgi:hypothetical protein